MSAICLVDTSIFCELLKVPNKYEDHEHIDQPWPVILCGLSSFWSRRCSSQISGMRLFRHHWPYSTSFNQLFQRRPLRQWL